MAISTRTSKDGRSLTINVSGRFDYNAHREFRGAYTEAGGPFSEYTVDLGGAEYIDSSALGMLLQLREHAGGDRAKVRIANPRSEVKSILEIANFGKLFRVD